MPKSPSWAKNVAKQVLWTAIDRELTKKEVGLLWDYFTDGCAYCGILIKRGEKGAHKDHLLPVELGGTNHISNRVLACANCNEREKRDKDWTAFLRHKAGENALFDKRKAKIEAWISLHKRTLVPVPARVQKVWKQEKERLAEEFDVSLERLRKAMLRPKPKLGTRFSDTGYRKG